MGKSSVSMGHFPVRYVSHNQRVIWLEPAYEGGLVGIFVGLQIQVKHPSILLFIMVTRHAQSSRNLRLATL